MRKLLIRLLEWRASRRVLAGRNVNIAPSVKMSFRRLHVRSTNTLIIGEGSLVEGSFTFERDGATISIGSNTAIGASLIACASSVEIGDDVQISWGCTIVDHDSHAISWNKRKDDVRDWYRGREHKNWSNVVVRPVRIGNKAWIGMHAIVLKGVHIGEGAIVGAGAIVTKNVRPWTIVAGNPAVMIREIPADQR